MLDLNIMSGIMRLEIESNLKEIKKYYAKRTFGESPYKNDIKKEFEEWINDSFQGNEKIWTLPDLTRLERFENFCRSIRKKLY
tara:strand:- start:12 stop:260 length:249 start_codon:yes stop_codon:yes gene_type:complete